MAKKKATSERVHRELTENERGKLTTARREMERAEDEILAEGGLRKKARARVRQQVTKTIADLRSRRESLGLSLADVETKSGLKRSALSRLENNAENANPTLLTLQRYAEAVGATISTSVTQG